MAPRRRGRSGPARRVSTSAEGVGTPDGVAPRGAVEADAEPPEAAPGDVSPGDAGPGDASQAPLADPAGGELAAEVAAAEPVADEEGAGAELEEARAASTETGDPTLGPPGGRLRLAREARGLSVEDLVRTLNLPRRVLLALEDDDYTALPPATFVRGYIKSYARLLGLAPQPLLDAHAARAGGIEPVVRPTPQLGSGVATVGIAHRRPGLVMTLSTLVLVAVVGVLLVAFWPDQIPGRAADLPAAGAARNQVPAAAAPESAAPATPSIGSGDAAAADATEAAGATGVADGSAAGSAIGQGSAPPAAEGETGSSAPAGTAGVVGSGAQDAAPDASGQAVTMTSDERGEHLRVVAGGDDHLAFAFSADCWVEVRDADDAQLYEDLSRAGQTLDVWGRAPFHIRLGYAPGVQLVYNDSRVSLAPFTRNDIASLVLGR